MYLLASSLAFSLKRLSASSINLASTTLSYALRAILPKPLGAETGSTFPDSGLNELDSYFPKFKHARDYALNRVKTDGTITQSEKSFFIDEINPLFIEELTKKLNKNLLKNKKHEGAGRKKPPQLHNRNLRKITQGISHIMDLNVNQKIIHNIFGEGTIKKIDNSNGNQKITVLFVQNGEKVLLTKFAKFKIIT